MRQPTPIPTVHGPLLIGSLLAFVVSTAALVSAGGNRHPLTEIPISPFGWNRVIVVHTLSTLMLSWSIALFISSMLRTIKARRFAVVWSVLGLTMAWLTFLGGGLIEPLLNSIQAAYLPRLLCRILWCTLLQVPWCLVGLSAIRAEGTSRPVKMVRPHLFGLAMVTAVGLPISFLAVFCEAQTRTARDYWQQTRLIDAKRLVQRLYDLGSTVSLGERTASGGGPSAGKIVTPQQALADLQMAVEYVGRRVGLSSSVALTDQHRLQLARDYLALDQDEGAETMLRPIADRQPLAAMMLARIQKDRGNVDAGRQWAEKVLTTARQATSAGPAEVQANDNVQLQAYDLLVVSAGEARDYQAAEGYLLEALHHLPRRAAEIHDRLGKHYEFLGELAKSVEHQRQAAVLEPARYAAPESVTQKILSSGAPVGLARPQSSRYK